MKTVNTNQQFESVDVDTYIKYIEQAEMLHENGLLLGRTVAQLAELLYEKDKQNED
jgi:hypothetical protein